MAEPIGLASGLLTLATFAFNSTITLCKTVRSFKTHTKFVRDLIEELEALSGVLRSLADSVSTLTDIDLSALDLPLHRCGNACKEFEQEILKFSSRSEGNRTSFRDWTKLRYMGDDINGFRLLLAGYKSTIHIALTDANLRKSSVTAEGLEGYRDLIKITTDDLEERLRNIDDKLERIIGSTVAQSDSDATELRLIKEERLSTQRCLQICANLTDHINHIQVRSQLSEDSPESTDTAPLPERVINAGLQECKDNLTATAAKLERHMQSLIDQFMTKSKATMTPEEVADLTRLREQWETARHCMDICSKAENHLKENISIIENYATGDAVQFMVSTDGRTIHGTNKGLGWRTRQVGGHLSDVTVQQISRDMSNVSFQNTGTDVPLSRGNTPSAHDDAAESGSNSGFKGRHGKGFKLMSKSTPDINMSSAGQAEGELSTSRKH